MTLLVLCFVGYVFSVSSGSGVGVTVYACLVCVLSVYLLFRNAYNSKNSNPVFLKQDEEFLDEIQEVKLRISLIIIEIKQTAEEKGINEERLNYHCSYFMGGKALSSLDLEEVAQFRSYIISLNELRDIRTEKMKTKLKVMADDAIAKAKGRGMTDVEFNVMVAFFFENKTIDALDENNLKALIYYIDNPHIL